MAVEVLAWNVQDGLADKERSDAIAETVLKQGADLVMLSEATPSSINGAEAILTAVERFEQEGYVCQAGAYEDTDGRTDQHIWLAMARENVLPQPRAISLKSRTAAEIRFLDPETLEWAHFYGVHLDDRKEVTRRAQVGELLRRPGISKAVIAGDFNALHHDGSNAQALRAGDFPAHYLLPSIDPGKYHALGKTQRRIHLPHRIGSLASRLTEMADGGVMRRLEYAGFVDADTEGQPTKSIAKLGVQIDHIVATKDISVLEPGVAVRDTGNSDHRAISATLRVA